MPPAIWCNLIHCQRKKIPATLKYFFLAAKIDPIFGEMLFGKVASIIRGNHHMSLSGTIDFNYSCYKIQDLRSVSF